MDEISSAAGAMGAALLQADVRTTDIPVTAGVADYFKTYFLENLHVGDVRATRAAPLLLAGVPVVVDTDIFRSEREMMRDPLYASLSRFGLRWFAGVGFQAGPALWGLSLQRSPQQGPFSESEIKTLAMLSPRLAEVATLSKAVGQNVLSGYLNGLQFVEHPALALDRLGCVLETNSRAAQLFDGDIRIRNRRLFVTDRSAEAALGCLTDLLASSPDTEPLSVAPIVIRRRQKRSVVIRVLPVHASARNPFLGARVILLLIDLEQRKSGDPAVLAALFGMTPSEVRIALLLAQGLALDAIALEMGIASDTVRNHLKSVFAKTHTHRQGELIALLNRS